MVDYNIEFGHIYTNENCGYDHLRGADAARKVAERLQEEGKTYNLTLMVDDYNPSESFLDIQKYIHKLRDKGACPDYLVLESNLPKYKDLILSEMTGKIRREYENYIEKKGKCPCSFLLAIWHLLRLGIIKDDYLIIPIAEHKSGFYADNIITILPERFQDVEIKAAEIIRSTKYKDQFENRFQHIYL